MERKNTLRRKIRNTLAGLLIGASSLMGPAEASEKPLTTLVNTEITYSEGNSVLKVRPIVYTAPSDNQRTEVMLGRKFSDFTAYGYFKQDNGDNTWIGTRFDVSKDLTGRLNASFQLRLFSGMSKGTQDQIYGIPCMNYKINDKLKIGILGYAVKTESKDPFFYLGPSATLQLADNISLYLSYDKDVLGNYGDLAYLSLNYKFGGKK